MAATKRNAKRPRQADRKPRPAAAAPARRPAPLAAFHPNIKVIGIGGGAGAIVSEIGRSLKKVKFVIADTDARNRSGGKGIGRLLFGQEFTRGLGTGLNVGLAEEAAFRERERFAKLFAGQDIVIVIACLGGGLGSGATKVLLRQAGQFPGILMGIFTLPFSFEGSGKARIASAALREIQPLLNVSITIPNEKIFKVVGSETAITKAFSAVNRSLVDSLGSLIDLISMPGLINIDFADLRSVLSGWGNSAFLHTMEASGRDRAEKVAKHILTNPLYQRSKFVPEKILFNIAGGHDLSMKEIERISREIAERNPDAKIIFGISRMNKLGKRLKATLLMSGGGTAAPPAAPAEKPAGRSAAVRAPGAAKKKPAGVRRLPRVRKKQVAKRRPPVKKSAGGKRSAPKRPPLKKRVAPAAPAPALPLPLRPAAPAVLQESQFGAAEKAPIRRNGLESKQVRERQAEERDSRQEKEWEIPAFLRFKK